MATGIPNMGRFSANPIDLDDLKCLAVSEFIQVAKTNVEPAETEVVNSVGYFIKTRHHCGRYALPTVSEDRAKSMAAGKCQHDWFSRSRNPVEAFTLGV